MRSLIIKRVLALCILTVLAGCRITISVPEGGAVDSLSGNYSCSANSVCDVDIGSPAFDETFVAVPEQGYVFSGWRNAAGNLCPGDVTDCQYSMLPYAAFDNIAQFLALDVSFGLEPVFSRGECGTPEARAIEAQEALANFQAITQGVDLQPVKRVLDDGGNGSLQVGLAPGAIPLLQGPSGIHAAASRLGEGRVVAFSGQDFLGSQERSSLLADAGIPALLRNAATWAAGKADARVLASSEPVAAVLRDGSDLSVEVAAITDQEWYLEERDWSAEAISSYDLLVIQVNEWGTSHINPEHIPAIRQFVAAGGGVLIAGAAEHWRWWIRSWLGAFPGDEILADTGIGFAEEVLIADMTAARLTLEPTDIPETVWCAYVAGEALENDQYDSLPALFSSAWAARRNGDLQSGLQRLIEETPALPVDSDDPLAVMSATVAVDLEAAPWPAPHPWTAVFPGNVQRGAAVTGVTTDVDTQWKRLQALGAYAPAGGVVSVSLPAEYANRGLYIQIGDLYTELLNGWAEYERWERAPILYKRWYLEDDTDLSIGTGLGGPIYLYVPDSFPQETVSVELDGVVPMGVYSAGETPVEQYFVDLAAGAPQTILQTRGKVALVVQSDAAQQGVDPAQVASFWEGFYDAEFELSQEPEPRPYESRWLFNPQVAWGYANATRDRIDYPLAVTPSALRTSDGNDDFWLFGHELGHQFQTADWWGTDIVEVTVNLWTMYVLNDYLYAGGNYDTAGYTDFHSPPALSSLRDAGWSAGGFFERLELYRQLVLAFGWDSIKAVMASYYDPAYPRAQYLGNMDGFAVRMSAISGRDLTAYLDGLGYPLSTTAREKIAQLSLPSWLPEGWE